MLRPVIRRFAQVHPNHKRIAGGALWVGLFVLAAKLCVALREMVIAWHYGISGIVDAYQLALTIATWLPMLLTAVATSVLVPKLVTLRRQDLPRREFIGELNGTALLSGGLIMIATVAGAPYLAEIMGSGLSPETVALTRSMAVYLAPLSLLMIISGYLAARLQARERHGYSFFEAMPAVGVVLLIVLAPNASSASPLVWGTLIGYLLQALILIWLTAKSDAPVGDVRFRHRSDHWQSIYQPLYIMIFGQAVMTSTIPIDQAFASSLGDGAVATIGYANRIIGLITTFGYVVLARALLPVLAGAAADGEFLIGSQQSKKWGWLSFTGAVLVTLIGWLTAPFVVQLLFERGAFSAGDTALVSEALRYGLLQLPGFFGGIVIVQWLAATNRYTAIVLTTLPTLIVKVLLNSVLVSRAGIAGLMLATAGMYAFNFILLLLVAKPGRLLAAKTLR